LSDAPVAEGEAADNSASLLVSADSSTEAVATEEVASDKVAPPIYSGFNAAILDLLFAEDEEELVTGSNRSLSIDPLEIGELDSNEVL
jgi:hypothetical protein